MYNQNINPNHHSYLYDINILNRFSYYKNGLKYALVILRIIVIFCERRKKLNIKRLMKFLVDKFYFA
jgi:hypothetical protein